MRVLSITSSAVKANNATYNAKTKQITNQGYTNNIQDSYSFSGIKTNFHPQMSIVSFTGADRNVNQVSSLAYENMGIGLPEDYQGGLGVVTYEGPQSMIKNEGLDVRTFSPIHQHNNPKGGYKFLYTKNIELIDGKLPDLIEAKHFMSAEPGQSIEEFAKAHKFDVKDLRYVVQSEPNGKEATSLSKYCLIEPTGVKGSIERMSDEKIGELQNVGYEIFEISKDNPTYNKMKNSPNYWVYTRELAKTTKPYSYGPGGNGGFEAEIVNSDFVRAVLDAERKMNTEQFGNWRPASYWLHDRTVATLFSFVADASARGDDNFNGIIAHHSLHNPGRNYQGFTDDPFKFARIIFDREDVLALKKHPQYDLLQNFNARGWNNLTDTEKNFVRSVFDPIIGQFKDFFNAYNITKIPIVAKKINPDNSSVGTVSPNFDKEMKNPDMDVASGIGADLREIETVSPLNGSTPASMGLDNNTQDFGRGGNILSERKSGFHPLVYDGDIEKYVQTREKNSKWLMDILAEAQEKGPDAVNKVLYNDLQIEQGRSVIGNILNFTPGKDLLVVGWGRPDEQKGFPITLEGFLKFLKREDVSPEMKQRVNLQIGWGDLPFDKNSREWHLIDKIYNEIINLDGGIYKNNLMLADGRYPNKLVGCATHAIFTSRREMCGITPLEAKAAGVPSTVTATGGPVDYINEKNGWKTKTAPEMNPPFDGLDWSTPADKIDDARIARSSDEVSDCFKAMAEEYVNDRPSYLARCKKNIEEHFDWHNNGEFNGGKSANKMYKEDIWKINQGFGARNKNPMHRLLGKIQTSTTQVKENIETSVDDLMKKVELNIKKVTEEAIEKAKTSIEQLTTTSKEEIQKTIKASVDSAKQSIEEAQKTSIEEIKNTVEETVKKAVENIKPKQVVENATNNNSKLGKIAAFTGGVSVAALGFGGWYFSKASKLIKEANKLVAEKANTATTSIPSSIMTQPATTTNNEQSNLLDKIKKSA